MISPAEARDRIRFLDESAQKKTVLHGLNPFVTVTVTLIFIFCVISLGKYAFSALLPFALFPLYMILVGEIPFKVLSLWLKGALPLLIGLGLLNPFLDSRQFLLFSNFTISAGWISYMSLLLKGILTTSAALSLIATTGLPRLGLALRRLGFPEIMVLQLMLMGRYITLMLEEGSRILAAWHLRAPGQKGLPPAVWGPLMGQWLMRTLDRSHRIYQAMKLRGFTGEYPLAPLKPLNLTDWSFLLCWTAYLIINRTVNLPLWLGHLLTGGLS